MEISILIATLPIRSYMFDKLVFKLYDQIRKSGNRNSVEIIYDDSSPIVMNIGQKRNALLKRAKGDYITFIDDDDTISDDYILKIVKACKSGADCIGISGIITTNGQNEQPWHISKDFERWFVRGNTYYRTPNHISPVKRELALKAGFPEISHGEDYEYSMILLPLLKTETKIEGNIYHYDYRNDKK